MNSPLRWFGGKGHLTGKLLEHIPPKELYDIYLEPFAGGASMFFALPPTKLEILNDWDSLIVNFYRVLRDDGDKFIKLVNLLPYSREEYMDAKEILKLWPTHEIIDKKMRWAVEFFIRSRQSMSGDLKGGWSHGRTTDAVRNWLSAVARLPQCVERLRSIQIEHSPAVKCLQKYDTPYTFIYADPPYIHESRERTNTKRGKEVKSGYRIEMSRGEHKELLEVLHNLKGYVLLSGYHNATYDNFFEEHEGWEVTEIDTVCQASVVHGAGALKKDYKRTEVLWKNKMLVNVGHQLTIF